MKAILPLAALLALASTALAQKTPDEALKSFTVADGLQIELFASEPMFVNPTCIDVDHKGRVWVCESVNYRCDLRKIPRNRKEGDRIVVLEDTDGDGKADKAHTFYQEKDFIAPLGVAVMPYPDGKGQRIYVCHSPHIYVFEDKDGDLKADGPPKILLTGFKGYDHDHGVHGIHFGPDGKLYFSVGDQGVEKLSSANGNFKEDKETGRQGDKEKKPGEPGASATGARAAESRTPGANATGLAERIWTTNRTDCQAATVWRCNPDGSGLELLAHNFRNPYEPAVDSFGTVFISDNDDDGNQQTRICYVMPGGNYGYWPRGKGESHWHEEQPGIVHKVLRTGFGSPTGMCWYEGTLLRDGFLALRPNPPGPPSRSGKGGEEGSPAAVPVTKGDSGSPSPLRGGGWGEGFYGLLLHTDAGPREVRCFVVKPKGAGYECDKLNLVTSTDNWFRPSDVCVAPDGSVFVSDWYDPGVGGHGMGDTTRGRIYRLTPKGHKGYAVPELELRSNKGMLAALSSPTLATRQIAIQRILSIADVDASVLLQGGLSDFATTNGKLTLKPGWALARAAWLFSQLKQPGFALAGRDTLLGRSVSADDGRCLLIRMYSDRYVDLSAHENSLRSWVETSLSTRREMLLGLRQSDAAKVKDWIYDITKHYDGQDPFYLAAINIAVGTDPKRREFILADFEKHFPAEWNDRTAKLVWELRPPQVIAKLDQKLADPKLTAEQKAFVLDILAISDANAGTALLKLVASNPSPELRGQAIKKLVEFLPSKWSSLRSAPELRAALNKLRDISDDHEALIQRIQLVSAAELKEEFLLVQNIAQSDTLPPEVARAAVIGLASFNREGSIGALKWVIEHKPVLRKDALASLTKLQSPEALAVMQKLVKDSHAIDALEALAGTRAGSVWLLEAYAKKELPQEVLPDVARLLRNSPHQDLRNRALIAFPAPAKLDPKKLPAITTLVTRHGDAEHGREVFRTNKEVACIRCHAVRGVGGNIGPDLSMIGKKGSRENLFESIITPDKAIADQFVQWVVLDKRGVSLSGLLIEETPEYLIIRDGFGKDNKLWTKDIEEKAKSKKSVMPDDAVAQMTEQDLIDVVAYLETLKTPALTPESWHILGPFDNGQNDAGLDKAFIPEPASGGSKPPGVDFKATYDGKDDKVSWRTIRLGADGYYNLQAFHRFAARDTVSYLYREIESPADQEATILIGTDDGCKLWVNSELLLEHRRHEAATPERDTVKVKLKKGPNAVLLKISNGDGPHGFYFTLVSEQELRVQAGDAKGGQP